MSLNEEISKAYQIIPIALDNYAEFLDRVKKKSSEQKNEFEFGSHLQRVIEADSMVLSGDVAALAKDIREKNAGKKGEWVEVQAIVRRKVSLVSFCLSLLRDDLLRAQKLIQPSKTSEQIPPKKIADHLEAIEKAKNLFGLRSSGP